MKNHILFFSSSKHLVFFHFVKQLFIYYFKSKAEIINFRITVVIWIKMKAKQKTIISVRKALDCK